MKTVPQDPGRSLCQAGNSFFSKDYFPKICPKLGGASVRFNNPCAWAHGQAQMTAAHFTNMCKGATRMIHWHTQADEWGFAAWQMEL